MSFDVNINNAFGLLHVVAEKNSSNIAKWDFLDCPAANSCIALSLKESVPKS